MANFKYPNVPNTDRYTGLTNRQMVEKANAEEQAEGAATEADEKDEGGDPRLPGLPTTPEPGGRY